MRSRVRVDVRAGKVCWTWLDNGISRLEFLGSGH